MIFHLFLPKAFKCSPWTNRTSTQHYFSQLLSFTAFTALTALGAPWVALALFTVAGRLNRLGGAVEMSFEDVVDSGEAAAPPLEDTPSEPAPEAQPEA